MNSSKVKHTISAIDGLAIYRSFQKVSWKTHNIFVKKNSVVSF